MDSLAPLCDTMQVLGLRRGTPAAVEVQYFHFMFLLVRKTHIYTCYPELYFYLESFPLLAGGSREGFSVSLWLSSVSQAGLKPSANLCLPEAGIKGVRYPASFPLFKNTYRFLIGEEHGRGPGFNS